MSKARIWDVQVRDRVAGHGMSMPSYELPYDGWEMQNPPKQVVEATPTVLAAEEMAEALERSVEVMQFAYMNAPAQPKEIAQALAALKRAGR